MHNTPNAVGNVRKQSEGADVCGRWFIYTLNPKFPPGRIGDDDISVAAEIQWDVSEQGENECRPEPEVLSKKLCGCVVWSNPTPILDQKSG